MRPSVEDLQAIWLFTHSRSSLLDAAKFLKELDKAAPQLLQYRALVEAAVVSYGRPFTTCFLSTNRKVVPLKDIPPPQHLAKAHDFARNLRNTMIGHKDATPASGYTASPNIVLVGIDAAGLQLDAMIISEIHPALKNALGELCAYFVQHCDTNLIRLRDRYRSEFVNHPAGRYELVISEPPADWLIPFRPKYSPDFRTSG